MLQAAIGDGLSFNLFAFEEDGLAASEVDVGRGKVVEALVVAAVVVVGDKGADLRLQVAGQIVVFEEDAVLERLMPALDLSLCLGMLGRAPDVLHSLSVEPFGQVTGDV